MKGNKLTIGCYGLGIAAFVVCLVMGQGNSQLFFYGIFPILAFAGEAVLTKEKQPFSVLYLIFIGILEMLSLKILFGSWDEQVSNIGIIAGCIGMLFGMMIRKKQ